MPSGRFSQSFVESRRAALQRCLSQILKHPLLHTDPDLRLFLESDTFVTDVKQRALSVASSSSSGLLNHASESKSASFFSSLTGSRFVEFDEYFDLKRSSLDALEIASKGLTKHLIECTKQRTQLAAASSELMSALNNLSTCELSAPVKEAFIKMADMEKRKAEIGEMQTKDEEQILLATAENYARLISSIRVSNVMLCRLCIKVLTTRGIDLVSYDHSTPSPRGLKHIKLGRRRRIMLKLHVQLMRRQNASRRQILN